MRTEKKGKNIALGTDFDAKKEPNLALSSQQKVDLSYPSDSAISGLSASVATFDSEIRNACVGRGFGSIRFPFVTIEKHFFSL